MNKRRCWISRYLKPRDRDYLMETAVCVKVPGDLQRIEAKFARAMERESATRRVEFEKVVQYHSKRELQDDFGWGFVIGAQYDRYRLLFQWGQATTEQLPPTESELTLRLARRIMADIDADRREWKFSVFFPEDQRAERARAEQSQKGWKRKVAELKRKRSTIETGEDVEGG